MLHAVDACGLLFLRAIAVQWCFLHAVLSPNMTNERHSWLLKPLTDLTESQREDLCDGCARCCLQKLEDEDSGETYFTRVACRLLDMDSCRCTDYANRLTRVSDCTQVFPLDDRKRQWLPASCAYLRRDGDQALPRWHHLRSGDRSTVHDVGISVKHWAVSEQAVADSDYEDFIIAFDGQDQVLF